MTDSLAVRMRQAADALEAANQHIGNPVGIPWGAGELRAEAEHVEAEEREAAEREQWAAALAQDCIRIESAYNGRGWIDFAREIVKSGWRRGEPDA